MLLSMMRMAADSTFILDQKTRHDTKIEEACQIVSDIIESGDEKVVFFSQWERMQRIMAQELAQHGIESKVLNGSVPSEKRGKLINEFMTDPDCRVFLSTDAGSTGLNLQAASIIINLDLPWNPAVLEQRIARVYRLGQQRSVSVINMVSKNTIEERMLDTLAFKSGLFEGVFDGGEDSIVLNGKKFDQFAELIADVQEQADEEPAPAIDDNEAPSATDAMSQAEEEEYEEISDQDDYIERDVASDTADDKKQSADESPAGESSAETPSAEEHIQHTAHSSAEATQDSTALLSKGMEFLGGLAKVLASSESRKKFVDDIVKEDPHTGQKSISIPVGSKETVENVLGMIANIFSALK